MPISVPAAPPFPFVAGPSRTQPVCHWRVFVIGLEATTLQLLIEHTPAAVAIFDSDMCYLAASRRYVADYQLAGDALTGRSHYEVFPEISTEWKEIHRRCLKGATECGREEAFPREDGTLDWVSWEIHPWHEASGAIGGIVLFSEVITAQKRFERELAEQQRELEALIDSTDGSIWAVDTQYRLIAGNARYHHEVSAILGRGLEKGESVLLPAFPPEALAEWQGHYDRALQGEQYSVEVAMRFAQLPRLVEYRVSPIRAEDGTITGVTVFGRESPPAHERKEKLTSPGSAAGRYIRPRRRAERRISNRALAEILDLPADELAQKAYTARRYVAADGTPMSSSDLPGPGRGGRETGAWHRNWDCQGKRGDGWGASLRAGRLPDARIVTLNYGAQADGGTHPSAARCGASHRQRHGEPRGVAGLPWRRVACERNGRRFDPCIRRRRWSTPTDV